MKIVYCKEKPSSVPWGIWVIHRDSCGRASGDHQGFMGDDRDYLNGISTMFLLDNPPRTRSLPHRCLVYVYVYVEIYPPTSSWLGKAVWGLEVASKSGRNIDLPWEENFRHQQQSRGCWEGRRREVRMGAYNHLLILLSGEILREAINKWEHMFWVWQPEFGWGKTIEFGQKSIRIICLPVYFISTLEQEGWKFSWTVLTPQDFCCKVRNSMYD